MSIASAVLAGGLQVHSIFNSVWYLYTVPGQLKVAINTAFHPDQTPGRDANIDPIFALASRELRKAHADRIHEAHVKFVGAVEELAEASGGNDPELIVSALEQLDSASHDLATRMSRLGIFQRKISTDNGAVVDPIYGAILKHNLQVAAVLASAVPLSLGHRDGAAVRAMRSQLAELESSTRQAVNDMQVIIDGSVIKEIRERATKRIHGFLKRTKVKLELTVRVKRNWRQDPEVLRSIGFE